MNSFSSQHSLGLLDLFWSSEATSQTAILVVIVSGLLAIGLVYGPLLVRLWRIKRLDRAVQMAAGDDGQSSQPHRGEITSAFSESVLEVEWSVFLERWTAALMGESNTDGERSPVRLLDVLDEYPLLPMGARRSLLPALPGVFLAIGLLGTFVGLALALSGDAFDVTGGGAIALTEVVGQVGLALRAALWGLTLSIMMGVLGRLIDGGFEGYATSLDQCVQRSFGSVSNAELTSLGQRAQHESLVHLGSELTRFTIDLTERLDRGLQRIERSTASAANLVSEEQRNVLSSVVRELSLQIRQGVEDHLGALRGALEQAVDHQSTVTGGLAATFNQMAEQSEAHARVTATLEQAASSVQSASASFSRTAQDFQPLLGHLSETGASLERTSDKIASTQSVVSHAAEDVRASLAHAAAAVGEQRDFVEVSLGEIRATLEMLSSGLGENLNQALRSVDDALSQTVGRLRETISESNDTIERMVVPIRSAEGTARELHSALERVRAELTGLGDWLAQAMKPVRTTVNQLDDKTADITRALVSFGDNTLSVDKTMDALRADLREEGRKFRASTSELSRKLQSTSEAMVALEQTTLRSDNPSSRTVASHRSRIGMRDENPPMSREALRHPGANLAPLVTSSHTATDQNPDAPDLDLSADLDVAAGDQRSASDFQLERAPVPPLPSPRASDVARSDPHLASGVSKPSAPRVSSSSMFPSTGGGSPADSPMGSAGSNFSGKKLGPDPYARAEAKKQRPLVTDLTPDTKLEETADELSLSGLLGSRPQAAPTSEASRDSGDDESDVEQATPGDKAER